MKARAVLAALLLATAAWCDGGFIPPVDLDGREVDRLSSAAQKGIMIDVGDGREVLLLQTTYHGPPSQFAWVIPVPGKPGADDVFPASPEFIDAVFAETRPHYVTVIVGDRGGMMAPGMAAERGGLGGDVDGLADFRRSVVVHSRMKVGMYDATVLSATRLGILTDWLNRHGYALPRDSDEILNHYVMKGWYFVALRMRSAEAQSDLVLGDVQPIGIRFETEQLVYPLYISRISSRQKTAMLLAALSADPLRCDRIRESRLPVGRPIELGTSYATIRRDCVDDWGGRLICEYRAPVELEDEDSEYAEDPEAQDTTWPPPGLWATRWWTVLDIGDMVDLTFSPEHEARMLRLNILRTGEVAPLPRRPRLGETIARGGIGGARGALLRALEEIDRLIVRFRDANGCYPIELRDMLGTEVPEMGLDSSGNPVPIPQRGRWHRPLGPHPTVRELPVDPLTGTRDTWVYEVTGDPMVDSGGFETTIETGPVNVRE